MLYVKLSVSDEIAKPNPIFLLLHCLLRAINEHNIVVVSP